MCLIVLAHQLHADYPLLMAANRDEFHQRPTQRMHWWQDGHEMLAGKDLQAGGTWMGIADNGRWAALTNYRQGGAAASNGPSRGALCSDFISQNVSAWEFAQQADKHDYAGYNLLLWDGEALVYHGNRAASGPQVLGPGLYGLSNALLDTPWPKVDKVKQGLASLLTAEAIDHDMLQRVMLDPQLAEDNLLPDTGIPLHWEKQLSACHIIAPEMNYGTRTCISVMQHQSGNMSIKERDFDDANSADQDFLIKLNEVAM
jgi:uncharacterized protein with NRDE domain